MTITRYYENPQDVRPDYQAARKLRDRISAEYFSGTPLELSMGMSADYDIAIEEGATFVRVGTALFGPRE